MTDRQSRISVHLQKWRAQPRATRFRHRALRWRGVAVGLLGLALGATILLPPRPILVWNASTSAPIGLYGVDPRADVGPSDMVIARVPEPFRSFAAHRHYLPANVPLVKRVAAVSGDHACARGRVVRVNGLAVASRRRLDGQARPLRWWKGCRVLHGGEFLLLMDNPDSFDGRYFGPVSRADVIGKAQPLWTR